MTTYSRFRSSLAALIVLGATFSLAEQASADAIDDITAAGQINVGVFSDFPPFSSASADMSLKGYEWTSPRRSPTRLRSSSTRFP